MVSVLRAARVLRDNQEIRLEFDNVRLANTLFGVQGSHIKQIAEKTGAKIHVKGSSLHILGDEIEASIARRVLEELYSILKKGYPLFPSDIDFAVRILSANSSAHLEEIFLDTVYISSRQRVITPKSLNQKRYIDAIRTHDIVIGIGPAGTGKTYLAMAMAVAALTKQEVDRIILTRPAVEAGERLGFLPGDIFEKVNPYLRPLYDALHDMMDFDRASKLVERGTIEVVPLAFMRGRTLNDAFVILDEAQNTGPEQMKMFLTRLGYHAKAVITGDITQVDLPEDKQSGLIQIQTILREIRGIEFIYFTEGDVVRHPLVQEIIKAYERAEKNLRLIQPKESNV